MLGAVLALAALAVTALAVVTPITPSGVGYLLGEWVTAAGLLLAPWRPRACLVFILGGVIVVAGVAGLRLGLLLDRPAVIRVLVLPSAAPTRWVDALIDEQDSILFGAAAMRLAGAVTAREHDDLVPALTAAYASARSTDGEAASPFASTYLGLQGPAAFDAVVIEPALERAPQTGVVFLHGFMGNVTIQCWEIAQAASAIGAVTVCPSTNWIGAWWEPGGESIVRATLSYLRGRGVQRLYLGGFSNGGAGLGSLLPRLRAEPGLRGLFFIAGVRDAAGAQASDLPVLVIQGLNDERMSVEAARRFAVDVGARATYVELDADHFLIMKQPRPVQDALRAWLTDREAGK